MFWVALRISLYLFSYKQGVSLTEKDEIISLLSKKSGGYLVRTWIPSNVEAVIMSGQFISPSPREL